MNSTDAFRWGKIRQSISEASVLSGLPFDAVVEVIAEGLCARRNGKSEAESQQIMDDAIQRYRAVHSDLTREGQL